MSKKGYVDVICGSMFSGKSEELIRRIKRALIAKQNVKVFKPKIDDRYHATKIVTHDGDGIESTPVEKAKDILFHCGDMGIEVVGIDEVQFFDESIVEVVTQLADRGIKVIVAGLDMDYLGKPFHPMPELLSVAEYITKVHAVCTDCGDKANYTYRDCSGDSQVLLGSTDKYSALCRKCFNNKDN